MHPMFRNISFSSRFYWRFAPPLQALHVAEHRLAFSGFRLAAMMLTDDFIGPEEIAKARPAVTYSRQQLKTFEDTLPVRDELKWLCDNGFMLVVPRAGRREPTRSSARQP
jgi:hypothetical protein